MVKGINNCNIAKNKQFNVIPAVLLTTIILSASACAYFVLRATPYRIIPPAALAQMLALYYCTGSTQPDRPDDAEAILDQIHKGLDNDSLIAHEAVLKEWKNKFDAAIGKLTDASQRKTFEQRYNMLVNQKLLFLETQKRSNLHRNPFEEREAKLLDLLGKKPIDEKRAAANQVQLDVLKRMIEDKETLSATDLATLTRSLQKQLARARLATVGIESHEDFLNFSLAFDAFDEAMDAINGYTEAHDGKEYWNLNDYKELESSFPYRLGKITEKVRQRIGASLRRNLCDKIRGSGLTADLHAKITDWALTCQADIDFPHKEVDFYLDIVRGHNPRQEFSQGGDEALQGGVCWAASAHIALLEQTQPDLKFDELNYGDLTARIRMDQAKYQTDRGIGARTNAELEDVIMGRKFPVNAFPKHIVKVNFEQTFAIDQSKKKTSMGRVEDTRFNAFIHKLKKLDFADSNGVFTLGIEGKNWAHAITVRIDNHRQIFRVQDVNCLNVEWGKEPGTTGIDWICNVLERLFTTYYDGVTELEILQFDIKPKT